MSASTISINPEESFTLNLAFKNADSTAFDLTGCSVRLQVRRNATSNDVIDKTVSSHTNAVQGLTAFSLSPTDTDLAIRAWQFTITLTDSHSVVRQSGTNYLNVTSREPTDTPVTVLMGDDSATITMSLAGPSGAAGAGVPVGGSTGQILAKASNADRDTQWADPASGAVTSVNTRTGAITLTSTDVGLDNVDNTSDVNKPISTATQTYVDTNKASKGLAIALAIAL